MGKQAEIDYLARLGPEGREHALNKPWSDAKRGAYLQEIGGFLSLMPPAPARLLDLGSGSGWSSCLFALAGYEVTATDIAPDMVELQQLNAERYGVQLAGSVVCDFEHLPFEDAFDVAVFYDCLHHAEDEVAALRGVHRALVDGGVCITLEPGRGHAAHEGSVAAMADLGVTERDMPPSLIRASAESVGFRFVGVYDRPTDPVLLTTGRLPRVGAVLASAKQFLVRATPLAVTRGHYVVLQKQR